VEENQKETADNSIDEPVVVANDKDKPAETEEKKPAVAVEEPEKPSDASVTSHNDDENKDKDKPVSETPAASETTPAVPAVSSE
jgi:hypothetical protein